VIMNKLVCDRCGKSAEVNADRMHQPAMKPEEKYLVPQPWLELRYNHNDHDVSARRATQDTVQLLCGECKDELVRFLDGDELVDD
jgi:hypothetical protein